MAEREIEGFANPFNCDRCGKLADGGVDIRIVAHYGSRHDTCTMKEFKVPELCDECFRRMIPDVHFREWILSWASPYKDFYPMPLKEKKTASNVIPDMKCPKCGKDCSYYDGYICECGWREGDDDGQGSDSSK